ncbi:MAG TPA: hypothetical protein VGJ15_13170 [Pirellulales bacterium]|jgi:hypothetical protein
MRRTLEQIRQDGLAALREKLGRTGMIRFLQQFEQGSGDYSKQRKEWVDKTPMAAIKKSAKERNPGGKSR